MFESPTTHIELRENCNELLFQEDLYIERKTKVLDDNHVLTRHGMGWSPREDSNSYLYERPGPNDGPERVEKYESDRNEWWELAPTLQGHTVDTEIRQALTWLALCAPRTRLNHRRTSYGWKHNAENYDSGLFPDHCYVSNGGLICARFNGWSQMELEPAGQVNKHIAGTDRAQDMRKRNREGWLRETHPGQTGHGCASAPIVAEPRNDSQRLPDLAEIEIS